MFEAVSKIESMTKCSYPNCETCGHYILHRDEYYCDVPIVLNKQNWLILEEKMKAMTKIIDELENLVTDEILGVQRNGDAP